MRTVLYHGNCTDGFCAAWAAWRCLGDAGAEYVPVLHGQPPPWDKIRGRHVYLLDFAYKLPVMLEMAVACSGLVVLDHHKTAEADLANLAALRHKHVSLHFDMDKSGGRLAWEYFHTTPFHWLVEYTEDRDLWRWLLPNSREVSAALASYPRDFATWERLAKLRVGYVPEWENFVNEGEAILRYQAGCVRGQVENAVEIEMDGYKILAVNCTHLVSEIAGQLAEGRPFGACYFIRGDGKKVWSLRSTPGGVDVSEIAKWHGGGGHRNAAGFEEG